MPTGPLGPSRTALVSIFQHFIDGIRSTIPDGDGLDAFLAFDARSYLSTRREIDNRLDKSVPTAFLTASCVFFDRSIDRLMEHPMHGALTILLETTLSSWTAVSTVPLGKYQYGTKTLYL